MRLIKSLFYIIVSAFIISYVWVSYYKFVEKQNYEQANYGLQIIADALNNYYKKNKKHLEIDSENHLKLLLKNGYSESHSILNIYDKNKEFPYHSDEVGNIWHINYGVYYNEKIELKCQPSISKRCEKFIKLMGF